MSRDHVGWAGRLSLAALGVSYGLAAVLAILVVAAGLLASASSDCPGALPARLIRP